MNLDVTDLANRTITSDKNSNSGIPKEIITLRMNCTSSSHK